MCSKTPVSLLQELLVQHAMPLPQYSIKQISGVLTPEFECTVTAGNMKATGKASNKKEAKHRSAEMILKQLGFRDVLPTTTSPTVNATPQLENCVGKLNELSSRNGLSYPTYTLCLTDFQGLNFTIKCQFGKLEAYGSANNKKDAKQKAAADMLSLLKKNGLSSSFPKENAVVQLNGPVTTSKVDELTAKLYKQLALNLKEKQQSAVLKNEQAATKLHRVDNELNTIEEIKIALEASEVEYTVEKFQTKPLILMLNIKNTKQVMMEIGEVYEEVLFNLLKKSLIFYNYTITAESRKTLCEQASK